MNEASQVGIGNDVRVDKLEARIEDLEDINYILNWEKRCLENKVEVYEEALNFYSSRQHLQLNNDVSGINFDPEQTNWRIGYPYLLSAEYGQVARAALKIDIFEK